MTPECLVGWRVFRKPGNVTEDGVLAACDEIRHRTWTGARCDLGVPGVILPTVISITN